MKNEDIAVEMDFYQQVAEVLGTSYTYIPWPSPTRGPNRWNNRHAGNGRFEGFGTVRMFSPQLIHISLRNPRVVNHWCRSVDDALRILSETVGGLEQAR